MHCENCQKKIRKFKRLLNKHVNVCQANAMKYFCSKKCKKKWILKFLEDQSKKVVIWTIGEYYDKCFFVRKIISVRLAGSIRSCFANDLHKIERLELVNTGVLKILRVAQAKT